MFGGVEGEGNVGGRLRSEVGDGLGVPRVF